MPGIVTSTNDSGSVHSYRMVFTSTSTSLAMNFVTGTTSGAIATAADKGILCTFQNQSSAGVITLGGPGVSTGASPFTGISLGPLTTGAATERPNLYTVFSPASFSGINLADWYATTSSSGAIVVAQLIKGV